LLGCVVHAASADDGPDLLAAHFQILADVFTVFSWNTSTNSDMLMRVGSAHTAAAC